MGEQGLTDSITHQRCPCGKSSDACTYWPEKNTAHCHSCGEKFTNVEKSSITLPPSVMPTTSKSGNKKEFTPVADHFKAWPERGLTQETIQTYRVDLSSPRAVAKYPIYDTDGNHVGNKVRLQEAADKAEKDKAKGPPFIFEGDKTKMTLFGMNSFAPGGKYLTITEGQDDAMAAHQMMGNKYPVISIHGSASAVDDLQANFEWINSFESIVICFDSDEAGRKAAKSIQNVPFPLGKIKVLFLRKFKDANEYLLNKNVEEFNREWWQAPVVKPDGLKLGSEIWNEIIDRKESFTVNYPFEGLNRLTYGLRLSELVVLTADTGVGKTSILKHIEHFLLTDEEVKKNNYGVGFLHLEEPNGDTALGLLSIHNSVPYHIPGIDRPQEELKKAYDELLNNDRVVIWDHFGSNNVDAVINKVRHMASLGCKYIVLDHLSIIVSDQSGDERKQLDEIATKLKTLTMELDLAVIAVIHTNRQGQIRGTAGVEQLANIVLRLERNKIDNDEWRRNITKVTVEKNRFTGYTGPACYLWYNKDTARLSELTTEEAQTFEGGGAINMDERF